MRNVYPNKLSITTICFLLALPSILAEEATTIDISFFETNLKAFLFLAIITFMLIIVGIIFYVLHKVHTTYHRAKKMEHALQKNKLLKTPPLQTDRHTFTKSLPELSLTVPQGPQSTRKRAAMFKAFERKAKEEKPMETKTSTRPLNRGEQWISLEQLPQAKKKQEDRMEWITLKEFLGEDSFDKLNRLIAERDIKDINHILYRNSRLRKRIQEYPRLRADQKRRHLQKIFEAFEEYSS
ncbi:hypothetical protein HZB01_01425 [Candidatus Woesearchaeota archaeon]|nr:hypothetical protein [Candidatus Woesearchaeota archaeon]